MTDPRPQLTGFPRARAALRDIGQRTLAGLGLLLGLYGAIVLLQMYFDPVGYYAQKYNTAESNVTIVPKPHDCDFTKAPIGDKECRYNKVVMAQKDAQTGVVSVSVTWLKVPE